MSFDPRNILVLDFGQLGDVVLSLPALRAIRERYPQARISVASGLAAAPVVELSGTADRTLPVDRVGLRDGPKLRSIASIARLIQQIRRGRFDFVIDLNSLSETNLLGYLSGAPMRLFSRRRGRSLDFLSNFRPRPAVEDVRKHAVDRYLEVVFPLGVREVPRVPHLQTRVEDDRAVEEMMKKENADETAPLVGLFSGASDPDKRWPLARFADLARRLEAAEGARIVVFAGPEERATIQQLRAAFPKSATILDRLTLSQLASAAARMAVFVSNDSGPLHLAAAVGTPVVMLLGHPSMESFLPVGEGHRVIRRTPLSELATDEVYAVVRTAVAAVRPLPKPSR